MKVFKRYKVQRGLLILFLMLLAGLAVLDAFRDRQFFLDRYDTACKLLDSREYQEAADIFSSLGNYKDSLHQLQQANYWIQFGNANDMLAAGRLDAAEKAFEDLSNAEDFDGITVIYEKLEEINKLQYNEDKDNVEYNRAQRFFDSGEYMKAYALFTALGHYEDSMNKAKACVSALVQKNATTICAGIRASFAVTERGTVKYAGENYTDKPKVDNWTDLASISGIGAFILGLKNDGTVVSARGSTNYKVDTSLWNDMIEIATGQQFIVGLKADGTVLTQGIDGYGETDADVWTNIASISTGWQHVVGLDTDGDVFDENGDVYIVGYNSDRIAAEIRASADEWTNLKAISTGGSSPGFDGQGHVVGLKADGTLAVAGDNSSGQCNVKGPEWSNLIAVSAGDYHTVGLKADGTIISTLGDEDEIYEKLKDLPNNKIIAVSAGFGHTIVLTEGGDVRGSGNWKQGQIKTEDWKDIARPQIAQ